MKLSTSIIVVTHNGSGVIAECLESVKKLEKVPKEVIVADNSSKDTTLAKVRQVFPEAHIVQLRENRGYGGGCNAGAREATGDLLLFMNQDVRLDPSFLDVIEEKMNGDLTLGMCGGAVLSWDGFQLVSAGQVFERWTGYALDYGFGSPDVNLRRPVDDVFSPNGAAFAVRKSAFDRIGGFNENLFLYFDETDLAWRARIAGFRVVCCRKAIVYHRITHKRAHDPWSRYYIDRNSLVSAVGNYELLGLIVFLPTSVFVRAVGIMVLTLFGRRQHARSMFWALTDFFRVLLENWRRRPSVESLRKLKDREVMRKDVLAAPQDVLAVFRSSLLPSTTQQRERSL